MTGGFHGQAHTPDPNNYGMVTEESLAKSINLNKEYFVVQRCWFSGPEMHQPLDYLRLFETSRDAEDAAYQSAHAWARSKSPHHPSVKTLLLPSNPRSPSSKSASYGFISHGSLFWARPLLATHVSDTSSNQMQDSPSWADVNMRAYAVITEGVIGGTGNKMSRRGTEVAEGRVFCGTGRAAHIKALQVCHAVMASVPPHCTTYVANMTIGKPIEYETTQFLQEWPPEVGRHMAVDYDVNSSKRGSYCLQQVPTSGPFHQQASHPLATAVTFSFDEQQQMISNNFCNMNPTDTGLFQQHEHVSKRRRIFDAPQQRVDEEMVMS